MIIFESLTNTNFLIEYTFYTVYSMGIQFLSMNFPVYYLSINLQYASDQEYRGSRRSRPRSAVRFRDEVRVDRDHLHNMHQTVRDLSADQERLESDLEREIRNRYRLV